MERWKLLSLILFTFLCISLPGGEASRHPVKVAKDFYDPNTPANPYTAALVELGRKDPALEVRQWGGIALPGGAQASLMMALAGGTAPDIGRGWFHSIGNDIRQNFLYPLNEWIGDDINGDGEVSGDEVKWPEWNRIRPLWKRVVTSNGKIYGIPVPIVVVQAVIFRVDMVKAAGLDPNRPPENWDEFYEWCKKLTDPGREVKGALLQQGQCAIALPSAGYELLPWIQSAGGEPFVQMRKSPVTGKSYEFPIDAVNYLTPEGENLANEPSVWRANWNTPEGVSALDFWYRLRWGKWSDGVREITGVARGISGQRGGQAFDLLGNGEVAMVIAAVDDLETVGKSAKLDPSLLSWFPIPAAPTPKGRRIVQVFQHYAVMYAGTADRSAEERAAAWKVLTALTAPEVLDNSIRAKALSGVSRFVPPSQLKRLGYEEYIRDIPLTIRKNFADIERGEVLSKTEPYSGYWLVVNEEFNRQILGIMLGANGERFDYRKAFAELQEKANGGMMFDVPEEYLAARRPVARIIAVAVIAVMALLVYRIIGSRRTGKSGSRSVYSGWLPFLLLVPALLIIGCWCYYPLLRGMVMALQDYRIIGELAFVGLDNFIMLCSDKSFWMSIMRTVVFVILNMLLAFLAPILLAILLTEVPRGKIFYRTLFFLPQMTSGIVIALMWKLMYAPTPAGFFNRLLSYLNYIPGVNIGTQTWLEDPRLAMLCCILPTVWAGMGMASLIYLAALQSLPKELYEAAEIDGAGILKKLTRITIPYLMPLIVINFVGAFIATFQGMGNIFLMTFGGPGEATMVIGMKIWQEAYINLRFSMATSMAWIMGAGLVGLTYIQIQFLKRVEYRRAGD